MGIVLSLITALTFGAADFSGGMASRRTSVPAVIFGAHVIGLVGVAIAAVFVAEEFSIDALLYGAAGGVLGLLGLVLLYRRLAAGPMSIVAPITAITSALVPAVPAFATGEPLTLLVGAGVVLALVAIGLISASGGGAESNEGQSAPITGQVIAESLGAGVGFGMFFILISQAPVETAPWPIVGARIASVIAIAAWVIVRKTPMPQGAITWRWIVLAGLLDTFSNVLFLWSADLAGLGVASVLSSLYPASTVVMAFAILGERMSRLQFVGFVLAIAATAMIAAG